MDRSRTLAGSSLRVTLLTLCSVGLALLLLPVVLAGDPAPGAGARAPAPSAPATTPVMKRTGAPHALGHTTVNVVEEPDGRIRVDAPDGPVWILQTTDCWPEGEEPPYPRCLICHCDIESATENMGFDLDCTFCHGGDPFGETEETAHVFPNGRVVYNQTVPPLDDDLAYQQFVNPSNLRVVDATCGSCHWSIPTDVEKSMMATAAGHYAGGLYQNNVVDTKTPIYGTFAIADEDGDIPWDKGAVESLLDLIIYSGGDPNLVSTHFAAVPSQGCARCHLWSRGKGYRGAENADGVYRADGCAACHLPYANDGLSRSADPSIDHEEKGHPIIHQVTKQIPTEQCVHCHHRGARIGLTFTGRAQMPPRLPSGPGVPGTTDERFNGNYHYAVPDTNPPDIHGEAGMHCIDCHVQREIMGDGNIYGHMDQATKIECRSCHGLPDAYPTLLDNDENRIPNVAFVDDDEAESVRQTRRVILTSQVTGAQHQVPLAIDAASSNPNAACAMNGNHLKDEGGLECYTCHAAWVPNCFGCHFERDERFLGLNLMTREFEQGRVRTNNKVFETLRQFSLSPNAEGRVAPYLVACQPIADVTAASGEKILDFVMPVTTNELSGLAHNPVNPHSTRGPGNVRSCAECHRAPPTLGLGSGHYTLARDHVYATSPSGVGVYDRNIDPAHPVLVGTLPTPAAVHAIASLPNVVHGTADFLYVALGTEGLAIYDRRPGAPEEPVDVLGEIDAIDVSRAARYLYVVDRGVGVRIYDNLDPDVATLVTTVEIPSAVRVIPWGIHLFVAAAEEGLVVVGIADHDRPEYVGAIPDINAMDVQLYAHYRSGPGFAMRAYVADPDFGVHLVDLLPDYDALRIVGGLPLDGAVALDAYTRYVLATEGEPSREHDYLYVAAGSAGLHVYDITAPDAVAAVSAVTGLGGAVTDVDVTSHLAPPGTDDYAMLANTAYGLQVVDINDPQHPVAIEAISSYPAASRVLVEVQAMDRFLDEEGSQLKENSHPFVGVFTRADIVRILSASIDCGSGGTPDVDGDGRVGAADLAAVITAWGTGDATADVDGNGVVDAGDIATLIDAWDP